METARYRFSALGLRIDLWPPSVASLPRQPRSPAVPGMALAALPPWAVGPP